MPSKDDIRAAAARLRSHVRQTPVLNLGANELPGGPVALKLEFLQHSGSFKARGAFNRLLTAAPSREGVAAASGGNHGAAVAYAARMLGHSATIFVPGRTPETKLARIASYGATVIRGGADYAEAQAACREYQGRTGALEVHAYDHPAVLAGQGTVGLEFDADAPGLTHVVVAVGGGGLIGGIAGWYHGSGTTVVGVEPTGCATLNAALAAGEPADVPIASIAADSLGARRIGGLAFDILRQAGAISVLVSDDSIRQAQAWLWDHLRVVAEPGGAAALAALLGGAWTTPPGARVGVLLCGANTDPASVSRETSAAAS